MTGLNKLMNAATASDSNISHDDTGDSIYIFDGAVRKNVDYFVKRVIDMFNKSCDGVYKIEQFSAWHGPDRLVDEDCQKSYAVNLKTLTPIDNIPIVKPGEWSKYKNYKGEKLCYDPGHYCYGDDEYGITYMISLDNVYIHYYPLLDKIEIVWERFGEASVESYGVNMPSTEFIRRVESLIPDIEEFSELLL